MSFDVMLQGSVFWIICLLGIVSAVVFFNRLLSLRRAQIDPMDFIRGIANVLAKDNMEEALSICEETPAPIAHVVAAALRHRDGSARVLRETVDAAGRAEVSRLERRIALLAIVAQTAPLLGLLGTIIGLIRVLDVLNGGELLMRAVLMKGAMDSLTSAAAGLIVAVVVQVMYGMLHVRLDRVVVDLEAGASEILALLASGRGSPESAPRPSQTHE